MAFWILVYIIWWFVPACQEGMLEEDIGGREDCESAPGQLKSKRQEGSQMCTSEGRGLEL